MRVLVDPEEQNETARISWRRGPFERIMPPNRLEAGKDRVDKYTSRILYPGVDNRRF